MLTPEQIAELLRAAEYFARRPYARIGRDMHRSRLADAEKKRRRRREATARGTPLP